MPLRNQVAQSVENNPDPAVARDEPTVITRDLSKQYVRRGGERVAAIDNTSIAVRPGEIVVLLGPSGCGKTTLLRCLAGLERPDEGEIVVHGKSVFSSTQGIDLPPERRKLSMLFQSYALWPHLTVLENVAYPLRSRRVPKADIKPRAMEALRLVRCDHLAQQHPSSISGGQQQRIALARALVSGDALVLFDEPLSNVDQKVREELRLELRELQRQVGFSAVYVTHDQSEALALADRIAVLDAGRIVQVGSPDEIYRRPATSFVARFMGRLNEVRGVVESHTGTTVVICTELGPVSAETGGERKFSPGDEVLVAWRPEYGRLSPKSPGQVNAWRSTVTSSIFLGAYSEQLLDLDGVTFSVRSPEGGTGAEQAPAEGADVWVTVAPRNVLVLPADRSGNGE